MTVVVLKGAGKSFCAGYDLKIPDFAEVQKRHTGWVGDPTLEWWTDQFSRGCVRDWLNLWDLLKPVVAQVHGNCLAGGTDLALHCDLVVAAEDARIGFPPVRSMGVPPTNMWLYHVGSQWTKRLLFTGDTITGTEARDIGLAVATAPAEALDDAVLELANRMALIGRDLLVANKRVVNTGVELMGRAQLQKFAALNDAIGHRAPQALAFSERIGEVGLRQAVRERDAAFDPPPRTD